MGKGSNDFGQEYIIYSCFGRLLFAWLALDVYANTAACCATKIKLGSDWPVGDSIKFVQQVMVMLHSCS